MIAALSLFTGSLALFITYLSRGIYGADSGDMVTAAFTLGVPHPPGYPLYTMLGWLFSRLPWQTPAWRIGLISALSHAAVTVIVYAIVTGLTKRRLAGIGAALVLLFNYVFFMNGIVTEVFALNDLFLAAVIFLLLAWADRRDPRVFYAAVLAFSLGLSHHHVIIFLMPAILFWILGHKESLPAFPGLVWKSAGLGCAGLLPYLYLPWSARRHPIILWDDPENLKNFIFTLTRGRYGTFLTGNRPYISLTDRFIQLYYYAQYVLQDFGWFGCILFVAGLYWFFRYYRRFGLFLLICFLCLGPLYQMYSVPMMVNKFSHGLYERFLLQSYLFIAIGIGGGMAYVADILMRLTVSGIVRKSGITVFIAACLLYIGQSVYLTVNRFDGFAVDRSFEYLGRDVLEHLPPSSLVLVQGDTILFTTQYVRYVLGVRPDVAVFQTADLTTPAYYRSIARLFPDLSVPSASESGMGLVKTFILNNLKTHPVFSTSPDIVAPTAGFTFIPHGIVYKACLKTDCPPDDIRITAADKVWEGYHIRDIQNGMLKKYEHLLFTDLLNPYTDAALRFARMLMKNHRPDLAGKYYALAIGTGGDNALGDAYFYQGLLFLSESACGKALASFQNARVNSYIYNPEHLYLTAVTYDQCLHDAAAARKYYDLFRQESGKNTVNLKDYY